jgi:glycosyltransferase involved in cell wall biosynthesis
MVGPASTATEEDNFGLETLRRQPNVHFLSRVAVPDVPRYMAACRVCLLPYKVNERTRNISSLKMYEYLACGKPVVSTDVPAAHEVGDAVRIAAGSDFVLSIEQALSDGPAEAEQRRCIAAANTWEQRVESISAILEENLQEVGHIGA